MEDKRPEDTGRASSQPQAGTPRLLILLGTVTLIIAIWAFVNYNKNKDLEVRLKKIEAASAYTLDSLQLASDRLQILLNRESYLRDSLEKILLPLTPYRPLVGMLTYRDSVQAALPFTPGKRVLVLPDSLPGIVKEVQITGSGNSFSVNYLIAMKGGVERSIPSFLLSDN